MHVKHFQVTYLPVYFRGRLKSVKSTNMCVDHLQRDEAHKLKTYILGQYQCHTFVGNSQYFTLSKEGEFRNEYMCARVSPNSEKEVQMTACDGNGKNSAMKWEWITLDGKLSFRLLFFFKMIFLNHLIIITTNIQHFLELVYLFLVF